MLKFGRHVVFPQTFHLLNASRTGKSSSEIQGLNGMDGGETDFETLVSGRKAGAADNGDLMNDWGVSAARPANSSRNQSTEQPMFSWQSQPQPQAQPMTALRATGQPSSRAITPDQTLSSFGVLAPTSTQYSQPLQPAQPAMRQQSSFSPPPSAASSTFGSTGGSINWGAAQQSTISPPPQQPLTNGFGATSRPTMGGSAGMNSFTLSPPPTSPQAVGQFSAPMRPLQANSGQQTQQSQGRSGLDKYESLL
jgi:SCY1-like protein 2